MASRSYVALLRGINVGRNNRVAMADLREALTGLGLGGVRTHLQSGNAVFTTSRRDADGLRAEIEAAVAARCGCAPAVLLRTADQLAAAVRANPFPEAAADPRRLHVCFLAAAPTRAAVAALDPALGAPDRFAVVGREVYVAYQDSSFRSRLALPLWEKSFATVGTARNWSTVTALLPPPPPPPPPP